MTDLKEAGAIAGIVASPFAMILALPLFVYQVWAEATVAVQIWSWHAVPAGLPALTFGVAACVSLLLSMTRTGYRLSVPEDSRTAFEKALQYSIVLLSPWLFLLLGWWFR
jgi:hypothetical protein